MEQLRTPFQGVANIVRFNGQYYFLSAGLVFVLFLGSHLLPDQYRFYLSLLVVLITFTTVISLLVSFYIYDWSSLYKLDWLGTLTDSPDHKLVNIHAGFDETSVLLHARFPQAELQVFDFYDPHKHTEVSIKRARKAYPPYPDTQVTTTTALSLPDGSIDHIFVILSAHEIRDEAERIRFFTELNRVAKLSGKIIVVEHLRDWPNFVAYNMGFFHFLPHSSWHKAFEKAGLAIGSQAKVTPFITTFILTKNGVTS